MAGIDILKEIRERRRTARFSAGSKNDFLHEYSAFISPKLSDFIEHSASYEFMTRVTIVQYVDRD